MPTAKGRNRKARRAAATAASPKPVEAGEPASKAGETSGTTGAVVASHEKQRRQQQRQKQVLADTAKGAATRAAAPAASTEKEGSETKSKGGGKEGKKAGRGAGKGNKEGSGNPGKKKDAATSGGDGSSSIADLDADDFLSGGFMSMAGIPDEEGDEDGEDGSQSGDTSGEESESDDDDDDGEGGGIGEENSSDDSDDEEANASAMDLQGLAETDPEFFSFLQKEEPTLLEFDPMDSDDGSDGEEEGGVVADGEAGVGAGGGKTAAALLREASKGGGVPLTMPLLKALRDEAFDRRSIQGVRRMVKAFRCGCHLGDEAGEGKSGDAVQQKFRIPSSEVYNELMVSSLDGLHGAFMHLLFPDRKPPTETPSSADTSSTTGTGVSVDGSAKGGGKKRRRRDDGADHGEEDDGADAAADSGGGGGRGPNKKKKRAGKGGDHAPAAAAAVGGGSKEAGDVGAAAAPALAAAADAAAAKREKSQAGSSGALVRRTARAAVILTKEDFKAAALLPVWKAMQPALYSFFKSLLHVLEELHDRTLLSFLLSRLEHYVPLLVPFPGLARGFLKALLGLWGGAGAEAKSSGAGTEEESEEAERVRLLSYLRVRQMATALPFPFVEGCMKRLYLAFAKRARAPPATQAGKMSLRVMEGCVVELYGIDVGSAYQNAFLYIRQLSLLLRRAMQHKTKDSVQSVRRWQVVTCLRLWTGVLAAAPREDELRMLIFPLAQVIEGIVRLSATLRHSPLVFQLVRMRQRLAAAAELYVPCSAALLEVIRSPALFKKATASTGAPPNVPAILRLGKTQVDEGRAQGAVVEEALRLLGQEMDLYRYTAAFPELVIPVLGQLKKFAKLTKVSKWRMMARGLVETLEARGTWAAEKRLELRICPSDVEGLEVLRPEGAPTMRERLGASESIVEERVAGIDEAHDTAPVASVSGKGALAAASRKGKKRQDDSEEEDDDSEDEGHGGDAIPKRKKNSSLSTATASRGKENGKPRASTPVATTAAGAGSGDVSAPDVVEDLGAWSDDEWS